MSETGANVGTESEGQTADVTTPRTDQADQPTATEEETTEEKAETSGAAETAGLDNEPLQAGAEPELGSQVE